MTAPRPRDESAGAAPARPHDRRSPFERALIALNIVVVSGLLVSAAGIAWFYDRYATIGRREVASVLTPAGLGGALVGDDGDDDVLAENFLIVGVDSSEGLDPDDPVAATRTRIGGVRSDTMMVLRVDPTSNRAALLSLPRDLYVPLGNGRRGSDRLNAAVQIGGPELLIETVQTYLGIPVNHYVEVDFFGFGELVRELDGVPIYFPHPVRDRRSGLHVPEAGCVVLDAANALGFVRSRAYQEFIDGRWRTDGTGDLGRTRRQQLFIVAALERALAQGLRNPVKADGLIQAGIGAVTLDDTLDGEDVVRLAGEFRNFDPAALDIHSLPIFFDVVGGSEVLRLQSRAADEVLDIFRNIDPSSLQPSSVRVRVLNGTGEPGQAAATVGELRRVGFGTGGTGDADRLGVVRTEVRFDPADAAAADLVRRWLAVDARRVEDPDANVVTIVTGLDWRGVRDEARPPGSTTTTTLATTTTTEARSSTTVVGTVPTGIPDGQDCG